ncbi:RGS1-HXK1-interacting protein 1 isoform X2 [Rhododendron vialii]|uniref:RGS1-HXK1-interacting protein 1 isoform X2 n=1 Tax=Rhododendron vialii TaxID=182163 RepID=UPI00265DA219|nr:RGS1-HXK1-interacting protein 1 isoform X2 [Rhododendron vialii]XP_058214973.1 RGS1-HXK1-interacting protein 1 isoform X2 [Rhododendron vialii]
MAGAPDENTIAPPSPPPSHSDYSTPLSQSRIPADATPWIDYAVEQARVAQKTVEETLDFAISTTRSRFDRFLSTGSAHLHTTVDSLQDLKSDYVVYEDMVFGKIKEGIIVAASHPVASCSAAVGLGFLALKRPRRFLYYNTLRLFSNEEKRALQAEEELTRGRTKLRQAGKQIQGVIRSAYKIERQAGGLKDDLGELPRREASRFRSQVSNLASEAKRERNTLTKEVSKISNYGISV